MPTPDWYSHTTPHIILTVMDVFTNAMTFALEQRISNNLERNKFSTSLLYFKRVGVANLSQFLAIKITETYFFFFSQVL